MTNEDIARRLRLHATVLTRTGTNLYRVRAFRQAAMAVLTLTEPIENLDRTALERVPGIGRSLAQTIGEYARTGRWNPNHQRPTSPRRPGREVAVPPAALRGISSPSRC